MPSSGLLQGIVLGSKRVCELGVGFGFKVTGAYLEMFNEEKKKNSVTVKVE